MAVSTATSNLNKSKVAAIQDYYMTHADGFYERIFAQPQLAQMMGVTVKDKLLIRSADAVSGLQSYQAGHHLKGSVAFNGRTLQMRMVKDDKQFETRAFDVEDYDAYLNRTGNDPKQFPYQAYVIEMILKAMYEDFEKNVKWGGVYLGPIVGAPNQSTDTVDGFIELIHDSIIAGEVAPYITGLLSASNAYDKIVDFIEAMLEIPEMEAADWALYTSLSARRFLRKSYRDAHGADNDAKDSYGLELVPDYEKVRVIPQSGLSGSQMVLARPDNLYIGYDGAPFIEMRYESRMMYCEIDWKYGMQFASPTDLFVNEWL